MGGTVKVPCLDAYVSKTLTSPRFAVTALPVSIRDGYPLTEEFQEKR
jgi:hypothetical protein